MKTGRARITGFSLIEVMIAILILGLAIVGLTQGITVGIVSAKESEKQTVASLFAAGKIEQLRAEGGLIDDESEGDCGEGLPLYRWKQSITAAGIDGLHQVDVVILHAQSGQQIYELRTLLFELPDESSTAESDKTKNNRKTGGQRR